MLRFSFRVPEFEYEYGVTKSGSDSRNEGNMWKHSERSGINIIFMMQQLLMAEEYGQHFRNLVEASSRKDSPIRLLCDIVQ